MKPHLKSPKRENIKKENCPHTWWALPIKFIIFPKSTAPTVHVCKSPFQTVAQTASQLSTANLVSKPNTPNSEVYKYEKPQGESSLLKLCLPISSFQPPVKKGIVSISCLHPLYPYSPPHLHRTGKATFQSQQKTNKPLLPFQAHMYSLVSTGPNDIN